jgi:hypothetical protein
MKGLPTDKDGSDQITLDGSAVHGQRGWKPLIAPPREIHRKQRDSQKDQKIGRRIHRKIGRSGRIPS